MGAGQHDAVRVLMHGTGERPAGRSRRRRSVDYRPTASRSLTRERPMLETTIAGSLPKPAWLAETNKLWPEWRSERRRPG